MVSPVSPEALPFHHPDVQAWLVESTKIVMSSPLAGAYVAGNQHLLDLREQPPLVDNRPPGDEAVVESIARAMSAEAPIVPYKSVLEYDTLEEYHYLVKVDGEGKVIKGTLTGVALLDHRSGSILDIRPGFEQSMLSLVAAMIERQEALPWSPILDKSLLL